MPTNPLTTPSFARAGVNDWDRPEAPKPREEPAKRFEFDLDEFQEAAIKALEKKESILVAAHTSAGKTVVAEYAVAMSIRDGQRVVYTSPLKALSNQKYRELSEGFKDVGLMTGDVTINPHATCLVMTTEVLRSMLYNRSQVLRESHWVVFDEIHYIRDPERGVVWEEAISLLPDEMRMVFLSATVPNAREFAEWVAKTHRQLVHVVHTDLRPVPLRHYVFPKGGEGLYLAVNEHGDFQESNFQRAVTSVQEENEGSGQAGERESDVYSLAKTVTERNYDPLILFSFSKKEVETNARRVSKLELTGDEEKKLIDAIFSSAMDTLSEQDRKLPQVSAIYPLLANGIGIHHGGMLPILKEIVEILFSENLIKLLCATETFSTGLNMPCRTAVFTSCRKFDGSAFRYVTGGEYTQMSGRAGRRGLDDMGIVILMLDARMEPRIARDVLLGQPDPIQSSFHVSYSMLLNLLRTEAVDPEELAQSSFKQFQSERAVPQLEERASALEEERDSLSIPDEAKVAEYHRTAHQLQRLRSEQRGILNAPHYVLPFLQPGALRLRSRFSATKAQCEKSAWLYRRTPCSLALRDAAALMCRS